MATGLHVPGVEAAAHGRRHIKAAATRSEVEGHLDPDRAAPTWLTTSTSTVSITGFAVLLSWRRRRRLLPTAQPVGAAAPTVIALHSNNASTRLAGCLYGQREAWRWRTGSACRVPDDIVSRG